MQSLMWKEFLGSNVDCYMKTSPQLLCTKIKEERVCAIVGKSFSVPVWFFTSGLVPHCLHRYCKRRRELGRRFAQLLILMYVVPPKDSSWFSGVL